MSPDWKKNIYFVENDPPAGVSGSPDENNIYQWNVFIVGPKTTPYEVQIMW